MAKAIGLNSSLFNVTSFGDMPFHQLQQLQCFYRSLPLFSFELHSFIHCHVGDKCGTHVMALMRG